MVSVFCHRCASQLGHGAGFCAACGAPQIRVIAPEVVTAVEPELENESPPLPPDTAFSVAPGTWRAIDWKAFLRIALPLAFLAGTLSVFLAPLGLALLPAAVILAIARYRKEYSEQMSPSQGAWLGACTGLLSFVFFLILIGIEAALNRTEMRQIVRNAQEQLASNPDPYYQQMANWIITPQGIIFLIAFGFAAYLALFVGLATVTGTLTAAFSGNRDRR
ncbi:MAG: hypothetical protein LAP21_26390 [Acidobacteriia bacterium]|nr:hypothetical protein [Terriglobia bacterium]